MDSFGRFSAPYAVMFSYGNKQWLVYSEPLPFRSFRWACMYAWLRCHVFRKFRGQQIFHAEVLDMQGDSPFSVRFPIRSYSYYENSLYMPIGEHSDKIPLYFLFFCFFLGVILFGLVRSCC